MNSGQYNLNSNLGVTAHLFSWNDTYFNIHRIPAIINSIHNSNYMMIQCHIYTKQSNINTWELI